jgi:hypothetical protein
MKSDDDFLSHSDKGNKKCPDCGVEKELSQFSPAQGRRDGRGTYCKPCMSRRSQVSYRERRAAAGAVVRTREALPDGHKRCPDCEQVEVVEEFPRNKGARDGRGGYCKPCHNARTRETADRLYGGGRNYHLKARYGITAAEYDALLAAQDGPCALCGERPAEHVDHDHTFGQVRGLLCSCCNQGLGNFRDRREYLQAAVDYLERTTWTRQQECTGVFRLISPRPAAAASPSSSALQHLISSRRG